VYRVKTEGGTPSIVHEVACGPLYGFAVDADNVYMGTCAGTLSAFGRKDGQETVLDTGDFALDVAKTSEGFAYVSCGSSAGLHLLGATGGPSETIALGFCTYGVTTVGDHLVVVGEGPMVAVVDLPTKQVVSLGTLNVVGADAHCAILKAPVAGGSAEVLAKDRPTVANIATDGNFIYWIEQSGSANVNRVMKQPL
jgi:hypothetical protein